MTINAAWHRANPMPKNPTIDQRIAWALEHAAVCGCRDIPPKLRAAMKMRGIDPPPHARGQDSRVEAGRRRPAGKAG